MQNFGRKNLDGKDHSENEGEDWKMIKLQRILGEKGGKVWIEFMWLRIGTSGGLL
jgi:hypothetical protein